MTILLLWFLIQMSALTLSFVPYLSMFFVVSFPVFLTSAVVPNLHDIVSTADWEMLNKQSLPSTLHESA